MSDSKPRVLVLTHRIPYPPNRGDRIRAFHLIEFLSRHADVFLGSVSDEPWDAEQDQELSHCCREVHFSRLRSPMRWLRAATGLAIRRSITQGAFHSPGLAKQISDWTSKTQFDAALFYCSSMWPYARFLKSKPKRLLVDLVDVDSEKWVDYSRVARGLKKWLYRRESNSIGQMERSLAQQAHAVTVVSRDEADLFRRLHPGFQAIPIGNGVDYHFFKPETTMLPFSGAEGDSTAEMKLVFVGVLDYLPNVQGLRWFCDEVLPRLREVIPNSSLTIVGRRPSSEVFALGNRKGVRLIGEVADVRPYVQEAHIAIAPLQIARGVQNKVLEALSCGKPVVATPFAATGIDCPGGLVIATEPDQWVQAIKDLMQPAVYSQRARAAREQILERYSWESQLSPLLALLGVEP